MSEIGIVTAFFDIGRGDWTANKGLPPYLQRTTETYLRYFSHLASLENSMVVFTSHDLVKDIQQLRGDRPTKIVAVDFRTIVPQLHARIAAVQKDRSFKRRIHRRQAKNPEYWSADYVLVTLLRSLFARKAVEEHWLTTDLIAWVDFGYCRSEATLSGITKWQFDFDREKIHVFSLKDWVEGTTIEDVIANNDVHLIGSPIVAGKERWFDLESLVFQNTYALLDANLIDDDQTLLLMSYLSKPELFMVHRISPDDWFVAFKNFSDKH
jgi:protein YibB